MIRAFYSLCMVASQPFLRRKLARRGRAEPGYLQAVDERFGHYAASAAEPGAVWVHAVSLGETRAAAILVAQLRAQMPGMRLLLTHGTATGRAEGQRLLQPGDVQAWLPWDTPMAVRHFLDHFRPRLGLLMETEVWPNLAAACKARGIPLALANGRLSSKSLQQALRLGPLSRPAYKSLAAVWAQTEADARRFALLGAPVQGVFGNLKFDAAPDDATLAQGRAWRAAGLPPVNRPVIMFASSREGEEAALLQALARERSQQGGPGPGLRGSGQGLRERSDTAQPPVQWLIVPRHPQRFDEVAVLVAQYGLTVSRRSRWVDGPEPADVWLGDSLGEMALYYGLADVALLGGSFEPLGGQNLIEAAACGCPVVMGPHTFNFAEAAELAEEAGAAHRAGTLVVAMEMARALAADPRARQAAAQSASRFATRHRGAAVRTARAVLDLAGIPQNAGSGTGAGRAGG